jgi:hypothetical protein
MKQTRTLRLKALVTALLAVPLIAIACPADQAKPFTSGPLDAQGMFSTWIVDSNGVGLSVCNVSVTNDGNPPPCFYDPVTATNPLAVALGRGGEAFFVLSDSVWTTTGANPVDAVIVMGIESAFLSPDGQPLAGTQTQFQRLRTRLNVSAVGHYTVETPWRTTTYTVDTLLAPGNGQNRSEISDPIDITFTPNSSVPGMVAPFLVATPPIPGYGPAEGYIGDGLTLTNVTGSPCGTNYVKVTAVGLDGVTPIDINNGSNVYVNPLFTAMGKLAPTAAAPLAVTGSFYTTRAGSTTVTVMADGATTGAVSATIDAVTVPLARDGSRFYASVPVATLPATVSLTATDTSRPSTSNTQTAGVKDLVTIGLAEARCSITGCQLSVQASSSDDGSVTAAPTLTLSHLNQGLTLGSITVPAAAIPASVTILSSAGGVTSRPVTVINQ